jgi:hypothetical protein
MDWRVLVGIEVAVGQRLELIHWSTLMRLLRVSLIDLVVACW